MTERKSGREYDAPNDRSTASSYSYARPNKGRAVHERDVQRVFDALRERVGGEAVVHIKTPAVAAAADLSAVTAGRAVAALRDDPDCPLDISRWSGESTSPTTWRVERKMVADGGLPDHIRVIEGIHNSGWYKCDKCGSIGDTPEKIDHHDKCPGDDTGDDSDD